MVELFGWQPAQLMYSQPMTPPSNSSHTVPTLVANRSLANYPAAAHRGAQQTTPRASPAGHVADALVQRLADMLRAQVLIIGEHGAGEHGQIVASSQPRLVGLPLGALDTNFLCDGLRLALPPSGQALLGQAHILIGGFCGEVVSHHLAQHVVQLVLDQLILADRLPNRHDLKNKFIHDLLTGLLTGPDEIVLHAKSLGLDLRLPRAVLLVDAASYILNPSMENAPADWYSTDPDLLRRRVQFVIHRIVDFFRLPHDTICAHIGEGQVAILKASDNPSLMPWTDDTDLSFSASARCESEAGAAWANLMALKRAATGLLKQFAQDSEAVQIGIGRHYPGTGGLTRSYQDARVALSLGSRFHRSRGVHCLSDLGVAAFVGLADERTKIDLAGHLLSPLDHEHELLDTLAAFFAHDCAASSTAKSLSIHRNTLSYRLDKITSLTGLDPRRFDDAVQIRLALLLRELHADSQP